MKRAVLFVGALVVMAGACSLNPQPFPPDNPDGSLSANDAGKGQDSSTFGDAAGSAPDADDVDSGPVPENDAGADAADASDALPDVSVDAPVDALGDAPDDVTND